MDGDIIVDVDADDYFIGTSVLQVINTVYQKQSVWFFYTNYITTRSSQVVSGPNTKLTEDEWYNYRISGMWKISHLKTYRR